MIDQNKSINPNSDFDQNIEILNLKAIPYPDGRRVKVKFQLSPFMQGPSALISMISDDGKIIASVNMVNIFVPDNEITLHVREKDDLSGSYEVKLNLFHIIEEDIEGEEQHVRIRQSPITSAAVSLSNQ